MKRMTLLRALVLLAAAASGLMSEARAQQYPSRPVTLVVPFPPGGGADVIGRLVAKYLGDDLGVPVVIENRGGAGGTIAAASVARAAPDGYTVLFGTSGSIGVAPSLYSSLPYSYCVIRFRG